MAFIVQTYDEILAGIITEYEAITGKTSITYEYPEFMLAAGHAAASSGLYNLAAQIAKQSFPQTATGDFLSNHAVARGLARNIDESDSDLRQRIANKERFAPASGNLNDFVVWALESSNDVKRAYGYPASHSKMSLGNVGILILSTDEDEEPDSELLELITNYIIPKISGAMNKSGLLIASPIFFYQDVTMTVTGSDIDLEAIQTQVTDYMKTLMPGGSNELLEQRNIHETGQVALTHAKLISLAFEAGGLGVRNATISIPSEDVTPAFQYIIRPGDIVINEA